MEVEICEDKTEECCRSDHRVTGISPRPGTYSDPTAQEPHLLTSSKRMANEGSLSRSPRSTPDRV